MKKFSVYACIFILSLLLISCNNPNNEGEGKNPGLETGSQTNNSQGSSFPNSNESATQDSYDVETNDDGTLQWSGNQFSKEIPEPDFGEIISFYANYKEFSCNIKNASIENARDYMEMLKETGYTKNSNTDDSNYAGFDVLIYEADNGKYFVKIGYLSNLMTIIVNNAE